MLYHHCRSLASFAFGSRHYLQIRIRPFERLRRSSPATNIPSLGATITAGLERVPIQIRRNELTMRLATPFRFFIVAVLGILFCIAGQTQQQAGESLRIPARPPSPLFSGAQGKQKTETHFDPSTNTVTMKMLVRDPNGYFIPNLRPENFAVYENGVRQQNVNVQVEHAPVSLGVLMEYGRRAPSLDRMLFMDIQRAVRQLVDILGSNDRIALWRYNTR
jgi:hypothetical protein